MLEAFNIYSLETKEKPLEPDPGEQQNNNGDGDAKYKPRSKIDALTTWIAPKGKQHRLKFRIAKGIKSYLRCPPALLEHGAPMELLALIQ